MQVSRSVEAMGLARLSARRDRRGAFAERVICSIRRGCLDHVVVFNERNLRRVPALVLLLPPTNRCAQNHPGKACPGSLEKPVASAIQPGDGPLLDMKNAWRGLMKRAEITDFRIHDPRHDFASRLKGVGCARLANF